MLSILRSLFRSEEGATMVEYGLLIALVALIAITAVQSLGISVSSIFNNAANSV